MHPEAGMGTDGAAEVGGPFHVAGGIPDWPVLHSDRFKFSLFLRRKHMPVTSMAAATSVAPRAASLASGTS